MDDEELLEIFEEYAENHKNFDGSFGESLREALDQCGELTCGQKDALENVVSKFRMIKSNEEIRERRKRIIPKENLPF